MENSQTTWLSIIKPYLNSPEMAELKIKLKNERAKYKILPSGDKTFEAFNLCPYDKTRVVIIGQDPYPNSKHAHGLGFSSLTDKDDRPASLQNLFIECYRNLYSNQEFDECFKSNNLTSWAEQGVLLINSCLTVRENEPGSHQDIGWEPFMKFILEKIDKHPNNPIIIFLGSKAQQNYKYISNYPDTLSMFAGHPSPLSAKKHFFGCGMFSFINNELRERYFHNVTNMILNLGYIDMASNTLKSFAESRGYKFSIDNLRSNILMHLRDIPNAAFETNHEMKREYEINWRT